MEKNINARGIPALIIVIITLMELLFPVKSIMCLPCYDATTGDYVGPSCPSLPTVNDQVQCEPTYRHCSCCLECAVKAGDVCHQMTTP